MKVESNIPSGLARSTRADVEGGMQVDVYQLHERPVAIVLRRGGEPTPCAAYRDSDDGRLVRFARSADGDVPKHDHHETHVNVQVQVFTSEDDGAVRGIALCREQEGAPFLTVVGSGAALRLYAFNRRANGIFVHDFRDRDALPVSDTFGVTVRAVLHGREGRDWPTVRTAKLVASYSSDQMARLMEVVNVRSRDDEWRARFQVKGLAGSQELAAILSSRWPHTFRPAEDGKHALPVLSVEVEPNTFSFYVTDKGGKKVVRVHQFTDFRGTSLEDDFPMGSSNEWRAEMPKTYSDMEAVNTVGRSLLMNWTSLPKSFPSADAPPYDPYDMDAAVAYRQRIDAQFAKGEHDTAYALYMRDPNGGAQRDFRATTKEQFVTSMLAMRDPWGRQIFQPRAQVEPPPRGLAHEQRGGAVARAPRQACEADGLICHEHSLDGPNDEQLAAVAAFCDANGRNWKEELGALWMSGSYARRGIGADAAALLQQVRNQFGPEWLVNVSRADLDGPRIDVGRDADLDM